MGSWMGKTYAMNDSRGCIRIQHPNHLIFSQIPLLRNSRAVAATARETDGMRNDLSLSVWRALVGVCTVWPGDNLSMRWRMDKHSRKSTPAPTGSSDTHRQVNVLSAGRKWRGAYTLSALSAPNVAQPLTLMLSFTNDINNLVSIIKQRERCQRQCMIGKYNKE